jgi:hypothetical protein
LLQAASLETFGFTLVVVKMYALLSFILEKMYQEDKMEGLGYY